MQATRRPSTSSHSFANVPGPDIQRSKFDRSSGYKTTFNSGLLIPFFVDEVLPGDTFSLSTNAFARLNTPLFPIMDNMFLDTFFFFVPYRLIWDNWARFNGEQINPGDSTDFLIPEMVAPAGGYLEHSIYDYMGLPTKVAAYTHSALPLRAYNLIFNEWFRDENLKDSIPVPMGNGPDAPADYVLRRRAKRHDYFTSALPWPQKGPAIGLPLGLSAPVVSNNLTPNFRNQPSGTTDFPLKNVSAASTFLLQAEGANTANAYLRFGTQTGLRVDLSAATAATINQLRQSFQIQRLLERDARGGTRYIEIIKAHFGVTAPDYRLQRPEYLGGGSAPLLVTPVPQTSQAGTTPQGNLAGYGTSSPEGGFNKSFVEHGVVIGLIMARADLTYQQGLNRMWSRRARFSFYWPALAHLGEQAVLNKEIYTQGTAADDLVFGYQEAFAEYRYRPSQVTGLFRSNATGTLDAWHLAQNFANLPILGPQFIDENPPVGRVVAVPTQPEFRLDVYFRLICARPMPMYSVPGLIDHF